VPSIGGDILALIEHLEADSAHLIGISFAPAPLVWAAVERPEAAHSLVLINPFVRTIKTNPIMSALFWFMLNNPWRVQTWGMYYRMMYPTRKPDDFDDYLKQLKDNLSESGRFAAAAALANSSRQPSQERLSQVQTPALVIMGAKDPDFPDPEAEGKAVAQEIGGALELIEGAGHYPQTEMPEQTARIVIDFLKQSAS